MSHPRTVDEIYSDYKLRKNGLLRALTTDVDDFYQQCDPERENLCLYGESSGAWTVDLPAEEVPPELPEPCLGINFARDGMAKKDWLALVAVHSDAWLLSVAFYYGAKLDAESRDVLFKYINSTATLFEVVTGKVKRTGDGVNGNKRKKPEGALPAATSRGKKILEESDVGPLLKGRRAELFWPDDGSWYNVEIHSVNARGRSAKIQYDTGEFEDLELDEIINQGHMRLIPM